jgi:hypothetical protein
MTTDINSASDKYRRRNYTSGGMSSGMYGIAFIGALIYYIQHATTLWTGILGCLKAVVWPAILVYKLMEFLKM